MESFRPLGQESRDIGQFVDDDGAAYLIFESRPTHGFFIAKLSDDYLSIDKEVSFIPVPLEGGALVYYRGLYYLIGSHLTGWHPNPNVYAVRVALLRQRDLPVHVEVSCHGRSPGIRLAASN